MKVCFFVCSHHGWCDSAVQFGVMHCALVWWLVLSLVFSYFYF